MQDSVASLNQELSATTRETMKKGSKSFSLAALLFDRHERESSRLLYTWCRASDDAIDEASSKEEAIARLEELEERTRAALKGEAKSSTSSTQRFVDDNAFQAFAELCRRHKIPALYPLELLEGMRMDVEGFNYHTQRDLELYCYRVAGVVGLMMVHVMGVSSERALRHAVDTGLAMQMTNIARDVKDDFNLGRIYLPKSWFARFPDRRDFVPNDYVSVVSKLVALADQHYRSGREGLKYLPFRAAFAVAAAQGIYREIGVMVVKRGVNAWDSRTAVPFSRKLVLIGKALLQVISSRLESKREKIGAPKSVFSPENL